MEIVIRPTPKSKKGHLARTERRLKIIKRMGEADPDAVADLAKYMAEEMDVTAPPEADLKEFIMQLSQDEFEALFNPPATVPPTSTV